jgi:hypothetical protein
MASPTPNGGSPRMPRQPKRRPQLIVDPVPGKKPKQPKLKPKLPGAEKPYRMPKIIDDKVLRTMPITQTQLKGIKKMYGI